jgi:predicted ATP-dependent serine protease
VQGILEVVVQLKPKALIIDSIQTIYLDGSTGTVGSVSQAGAPLPTSSSPLPFIAAKNKCGI